MRLPVITGFLLPALLAASAAAAQDPPPRDPLDDTTVRLGPVGLTPLLTIRDVGRDNNVFNEASNPKTDFTATISPRLDVMLHPGPLLLTLTTTSDYVYYQTYTTERGWNLGSTVRADFTFGPVRPFVTAGGSNSKDRLNREIDARAEHRDRSYGAGVRVQIAEPLFVAVEARQRTTTFDEDATFRGESLAASLNGKMDAIDGTVGFALTPLTSLSVVVTEQRDRFDLSSDRDSDTLKIMPTVTFSPLAILSGSAAFGYRRFTTLSPLVPDYDGFVSTLTLSTTVHEKHRFETTFARDVQYSYEQDTVYYIETGVQGTWTWQVAGPFDIRLTGSRARLQYQSPALTAGDDEDVAFTYGGGVSYRLREHLRVGVNADWRERTSERSADRGFDNRKIYANVTWGKQ
jgi:opacity protein-like surface antigen